VPVMLIRHKVANYTRWREHFDDYQTTRRANGSQGGHVFRSADDPNELLIFLEWDELDRARLFADSDDLRVAMKHAEVSDQPDLWFLLDGERLSN
jgi:heme-degrading monooxygenase HmoA